MINVEFNSYFQFECILFILIILTKKKKKLGESVRAKIETFKLSTIEINNDCLKKHSY